MSLRLEMLQVARLGPGVLGESASLVEGFVRSCQRPDGGFAGRSGKSDLYYTSFAVDALCALRAEIPEDTLTPFLESFGAGESLDFVHACCLARLWSALPGHRIDPARLDAILGRVETFRTPDGGYDAAPGAPGGSAYGCLLGYAAHADHGRRPPDADRIGACLADLRVPGGGWANDRRGPVAVAAGPATAAAVSLSRNLRLPLGRETGEWLLGCFHPGGGFKAFPNAPMPDLLSTAVILHALDGLQVPLGGVKEPCLDFIDSLWTGRGGFHGNWTDDVLDVEYTYYGLLALGHLAL
jgi:hypothetical protein